MRIIKINENNAHYWHMRLWNWLSRNPKERKESWPGWAYVEHAAFNCFACEIAKNRFLQIKGYHDLTRRCEVCPIVDWRSFKEGNCEKLEFGDWKKFLSARKKYAKIIANMKWEYIGDIYASLHNEK